MSMSDTTVLVMLGLTVRGADGEESVAITTGRGEDEAFARARGLVDAAYPDGAEWVWADWRGP